MDEELICELEEVLEELHNEGEMDDYWKGVYDLVHFIKHKSPEGINRLIKEIRSTK